jgi:hypothetical protein
MVLIVLIYRLHDRAEVSHIRNVKRGVRLILALKADGKDLVPGVLGPDNKLTTTSEGPFRVVSPQKVVGPPDQASTNPKQGKIWQYDASADHNAGFATKCTTIIKVEPLPAGGPPTSTSWKRAGATSTGTRS